MWELSQETVRKIWKHNNTCVRRSVLRNLKLSIKQNSTNMLYCTDLRTVVGVYVMGYRYWILPAQILFSSCRKCAPGVSGTFGSLNAWLFWRATERSRFTTCRQRGLRNVSLRTIPTGLLWHEHRQWGLDSKHFIILL